MSSYTVGLEYINKLQLEAKDNEIEQLKEELALYKQTFGALIPPRSQPHTVQYCNSREDITSELQKICS
jgi:hypothetical protein